MNKYTEVVPRGQGSPNSPHQRGTVTQLNTEGGSLQAAPAGGQGNPNTITTGEYRGRNREGEDITVEVQRLRMGQTGGPSGMTAEKLKAWLREATREK